MKTRHCNLCENEIRDIMAGSKCGLTDQKPMFYKKCDKVNFGAKLEERIITVNSNFQNIKRKKVLSWILIMLFMSCAIGLFIFSYWLFDYSNNIARARNASFVPYFFIGMGVTLFILSCSYFNGFYKDFKLAKHKKKLIDDILAIYGITYDISFKIDESILGLFPDVVTLTHFEYKQIKS